MREREEEGGEREDGHRMEDTLVLDHCTKGRIIKWHNCLSNTLQVEIFNNDMSVELCERERERERERVKEYKMRERQEKMDIGWRIIEGFLTYLMMTCQLN